MPAGRTVATVLAGSLLTLTGAHADVARTFATEIACAKAPGLGAGMCRQAFAAARIEFEAKTRSYPNRFACFRAYGPCMPWPAGAAPYAHFRPQWMGVTVVGPAGSLTALPIVAPGRVALALTARSLAEAVAAASPPAEERGGTPAKFAASEQLCRQIEETARRAHLPPAFLARLLWQESSFRADVVSPAGALGIAQFMPATAEERGLADPFDPARAIEASAELLGDLTRRFGNLGLAAAAYNGGPARVSDWLRGQGSLATETQNYVARVTGRPVEAWSAGAPDGDFLSRLPAPCRFTPLDAKQ